MFGGQAALEEFIALPTSIGELYMLPRPLLNGLAWRSQRPVNGSCTSSGFVRVPVSRPLLDKFYYGAMLRGQKFCAYPEAGSSAPRSKAGISPP